MRTCKIVLADHRVNLKESKKKDEDLEPSRELKKTTTEEHENFVYTNCNLCAWYSHQRINKGTEGLGNDKKSGDYPNNCIIEVGQNTEKSPGDLRRLAVTQLR